MKMIEVVIAQIEMHRAGEEYAKAMMKKCQPNSRGWNYFRGKKEAHRDSIDSLRFYYEKELDRHYRKQVK